MPEWLSGMTRNHVGSARAGSNPAEHVHDEYYFDVIARGSVSKSVDCFLDNFQSELQLCRIVTDERCTMRNSEIHTIDVKRCDPAATPHATSSTTPSEKSKAADGAQHSSAYTHNLTSSLSCFNCSALLTGLKLRIF
ncbi:uncharacterized protein [Physcomitrium patens]|uniref:uncharacterized protein n=1 Tax=Physcomitrium patens TaxID=3218 RepID=UPI003CCD9035